MSEEHHILAARQGSQVNSSHGLNINTGRYEQLITTEAPHRPRDPETRNPEMLARALLRARETNQNKENLVPEKSGSRRQRRRRVSTSRSPLPADYPRAPLQDITLYMHKNVILLGAKNCSGDALFADYKRTSTFLFPGQILERTRTRDRARMQMHGTTPPRQSVIHVSSQEIIPEIPLQEMESVMANPTSVLEDPLQETEIGITNRGQETETTMANPTMVHVSSQEIIPEISLQETESVMAIPTSVLEGHLQETEIGITNRGQETEITMANPTMVLEGPSQQSQTTIARLYQILESTRTRARARMQMHGTTPRQPVIHVSSQEIIPEIPLQEMESVMANPTSVLEDLLQETEIGTTNRGQETETTMANPVIVLEGPLQQSQTTITNTLQVPEDSTLINSAQLPEQETHGLTIDPQTEEQNYTPERALSHHGNIITDSSLTTDVGLGCHHDYHKEEARARNVSMLANQEHDRAFGTVLQSETWNEPSGRSRGGSRPQPKKKLSLKPLMKMR